MWSDIVQNSYTALLLMVDSIKACPAWPVLKHSMFILVFLTMLRGLFLRRSYSAVVLLISSLVAVVVCQTPLTEVAVPDCFASKLLAFVVGVTITAVNIYFHADA
jgi:hypothetical protein